jgi:hypothetical protein
MFATLLSRAQDLGLTLPGSLTIFRPLAGPTEGVFTAPPFSASLFGSVGYDDNIFTSHNHRLGSGLDSLSLDVASHIGTERTRLNADLRLGLIAYWNRPGQAVDPDLSLDLTFTHQFTPRLVLGFSSFAIFQGQPNFSLGVGQVNNVGNYVYTTNTASLGYQWAPRVSTVTSYTLNSLYYQNSVVGSTQNRLEHIIAQQLRFLVFPTITAVGEYRFGYEQYVNTNFDSYSHFVLAGGDFMLTPRLQFIFRGGAEFRTALFKGGTSLSYPYFDSTLTYTYRPDSYIQWYNRYGLEQSNIATVNYDKVYRTGLRVLHSFGQKLKLGTGLYYSYNQYNQPVSFDENDLDASVTATYQITRAFGLQADYTFTRVFSIITSRDYYRNRISLGATFTY